MRNLPLIGLLALFAAGCNSTTGVGNNLLPPDETDGGTDNADLAQLPPDMLDVGAASTTYPAFMPDAPQVIAGGGPVLHSPKWIPVFFADEDAATVTAMTDFAAKLGATPYWKATTSEYGVGVGTSLAAVQLTEKAPTSIDDTAIQTWLKGKLNTNDPALPQPTGGEIYVIHYPATTTITQASQMGTLTSCQDFGGYHGDTKLDAMHKSRDVAYAVIPHCDNFGGLSGVDSLTATESHELIEAATDPYPNNSPAYAQTDEAHLYWLFVLGGGETGDMCAQDPNSFTKFPGFDYVVQRSWSNIAAAAGKDPCVPVPSGQTYFAAVPELTDTVSLNFGQTIDMTGVNIPVGQSKTIAVDLLSDGPTSRFTVTARDAASLMGGKPTLGFSFDRSSGVNGEKLLLTITSKSKSQYGASVFLLNASQNGQDHMWFGLVGQ